MAKILDTARIHVASRLGFPSWLRLPLVGDVDNKFRAPVAQLNSNRFGESEGLPFVMEIVVDGERSAPAGVGQKVDSVFFKEKPRLLFNVSFACGKPRGLFRTGVYGDPRSIWFNVFFGYYEIDVDKEEWGRPFGYEANGTDIHWDDIIRIGKSDWNYFSNWVYGVPDQAIDPTNALHPPPTTRSLGRHTVGAKQWDQVVIDDALVVSAYASGRKGQPKLVERELWSLLWRTSYGFPINQPVVEQPDFFAVPMKANLYMCWREKKRDNDLGKTSYQTFLFGGTINQWYSQQSPEKKRENEAFLEEQLAAVRRVMVSDDFKDLGF